LCRRCDRSRAVVDVAPAAANGPPVVLIEADVDRIADVIALVGATPLDERLSQK
jgi:hypothetical protein